MIAIVNPNIGWSAVEEKQRIADNQYGGMETTQVNWLFSRLPAGHMEYEDLQQMVRMWALQAAEQFDPDRSTKFSSYLFGHLRLMSMKFQRQPWAPSRRPAGKQITQVGTFDTRSGNIRGDSIENTHFFVASPSADMQVSELKDTLSESSLDLFHKLAMHEDQDGLCRAFRSAHWRKQVSRITGLPVEQIEQFKEEIKCKAPVCV